MIRLGLGVLFVVLGLIGLFLPFLQGILFLFIGLALLAPDVPFIRRTGERLRARYPRQAARLQGARRRLVARWRAIFRIRSRPRVNPDDRS